MRDELSYEEALIAAVLWHFDQRDADQHEYYEDARDAIRLSSPLVGAALERGPKGKADAKPIVRSDDWTVASTCSACDATHSNWRTAERNGEEWKSRALAAEARVKELEAKLTASATTDQQPQEK